MLQSLFSFRAHSWSFQPGFPTATTSSSSINSTFSNTITTIKDEEYEPPDDYSRTKSSSNSSLRIPGLPTPHTPHTPHPHSAIPVLTSKFNFSDNNQASGPLNLSTGGGLPSSLLSPAPSHPSTSSLSSSREELEPEAMMTEAYHHSPYHAQPPQTYIPTSYSTPLNLDERPQYSEIDGPHISVGNPTYLKQEHSSLSYGKIELINPSNLYTQPEEHLRNSMERSLYPPSSIYEVKDEEYNVDVMGLDDQTSPLQYQQLQNSHALPERYLEGSFSPADGSSGPSNLGPLEPSSYGHQWPTIVWSVFMAGVRVHFIIRKDNDGQVSSNFLLFPLP